MRTKKNELSYFSFDVDFFSDKKVKILKARFGSDGIILYIYLLCQIYENGYYLHLDDDWEYIISNDLGMSAEKIGLILNFLLERSLFNDILFKSDKVLTSRSIQVRYQYAMRNIGKKRSVSVDGKYWLLESSENESFIKVTQKEHISEKKEHISEKKEHISEKKAFKMKYENEIEIDNENEIRNRNIAEVAELYEKNIGTLSPIIADKILDWLNDVDKSLIEYAIEQAVSNNAKTWNYINTIIDNNFKAGLKNRADIVSNTTKTKKSRSDPLKGEYELDDMAAIERKKRLERNKNENGG